MKRNSVERLRRAPKLLNFLVGAIVVVAAGATTRQSHAAPFPLGWRWMGVSTPVATGTPLLPPPSHFAPLVPRFFALLQGYLALDAADRPTFASWVVLNGVTDPWMIEGMATLYVWWERAQGSR